METHDKGEKMKCAIVIAEGIKQIIFTPENEAEKQAIKMIDVDDNITVERKTGEFYSGYRDHQMKSYNVALCKGGYLRAFEDSDSLMLVLKPKKKTDDVSV